MLVIILFLMQATTSLSEELKIPTVTRLGDGPIIAQNMDDRMGGNVQGPSLMRVPDWVENPLGKYYLYFADHRGTYIRLAYADDLLGPWQTHKPGSLQLHESHFPTEVLANQFGYAHIASPDVHVRDDLRQIVMYVHGYDPGKGVGSQVTRVAVSTDGINFVGEPEVLGRSYFRVFKFDDYYYALAMPGYLYRSRNGINNFEAGPQLFNNDMRHSALLIRDNALYVFWTQAGHAPERILLSMIDLQDDLAHLAGNGADRDLAPGARLGRRRLGDRTIDTRLHRRTCQSVTRSGDF